MFLFAIKYENKHIDFDEVDIRIYQSSKVIFTEAEVFRECPVFRLINHCDTCIMGISLMKVHQGNLHPSIPVLT